MFDAQIRAPLYLIRTPSTLVAKTHRVLRVGPVVGTSDSRRCGGQIITAFRRSIRAALTRRRQRTRQSSASLNAITRAALVVSRHPTFCAYLKVIIGEGKQVVPGGEIIDAVGHSESEPLGIN